MRTTPKERRKRSARKNVNGWLSSLNEEEAEGTDRVAVHGSSVAMRSMSSLLIDPFADESPPPRKTEREDFKERRRRHDSGVAAIKRENLWFKFNGLDNE
jgi:hypothetical protein